MRLDTSSTTATERFAQEMLLSWEMAWEGQRRYDEAYNEANKCNDASDDLWNRMDAGESMQEAADKMTDDVEARAIAAGVDVTDMLYLVEQRLNGADLAGSRCH